MSLLSPVSCHAGAKPHNGRWSEQHAIKCHNCLNTCIPMKPPARLHQTFCCIDPAALGPIHSMVALLRLRSGTADLEAQPAHRSPVINTFNACDGETKEHLAAKIGGLTNGWRLAQLHHHHPRGIRVASSELSCIACICPKPCCISILLAFNRKRTSSRYAFGRCAF